MQEMVKNGISLARATALLRQYSEIPAISYSAVRKLKSKKKYSTAFGKAYNDYGIYVFYEAGTCNIMYIGEAAGEPFSGRLKQHFNNSYGGLPFKKPYSVPILNKCEILILYGKYNSTQKRETHLDEDLLIGIFRPQLNDR